MGNALSQEEIDTLLGLNMQTDEPEVDEELDGDEKDALGEVSNINMGTAATTLSSLVNQKVSITTPNVNITNWKEFSKNYTRPCVVIEVQYKEGLIGTNFMILKDTDVKIITNLMMGGDGKNVDFDEPIGELHLSAIGEAMNQMVGSASTSMFSMFNKKIDIQPPHAQIVDFELQDLPEVMKDTNLAQLLGDKFVQIQFDMVIGDLIDSVMMQIYPVEFAKDLYSNLIQSQGISNEAIQTQDTEIKQELGNEAKQSEVQQPEVKREMPQAPQTPPPVNPNNQRVDNMNVDYNSYNTMNNVSRNVDVQPVQFQQFETHNTPGNNENIDLIMDVPLQISVELGRTKKPIKEILEFAPGSIVELDKLAGDPVDILVNSKMVAKGEVVVIDENFAIRITEIINKKINLY